VLQCVAVSVCCERANERARAKESARKNERERDRERARIEGGKKTQQEGARGKAIERDIVRESVCARVRECVCASERECV